MSQPILTEEVLEPQPEAQAIAARSSWQLFKVRFMQDKVAVGGAVLIMVLLVLAIAAPLLAKLVGHGPNQLFNQTMLTPEGLPKGPNSKFWFGSDSSGRDLFVRVLYGARTALEVGLIATGMATIVGIALGLTAGFVGGKIDTVISRAVDRSLGARRIRIMTSELLPNLVAPIAVYTTLIIPSNILFEAYLSFLGVGVPQSTPSWGQALSDAAGGQLFTYAWWMMVFPGAFLLLTTLSFNLVGDGLRDALGPAER